LQHLYERIEIEIIALTGYFVREEGFEPSR